MKSAEEIMQMLEAFDLTGSLRDAAELAGCSHHTVARHVAARDAGGLTDQLAARPQLIDEFLPKLEEWMEHSKGKIRADVAHDKLVALGYCGAERTTRRTRNLVHRSVVRRTEQGRGGGGPRHDFEGRAERSHADLHPASGWDREPRSALNPAAIRFTASRSSTSVSAA